MAIRVDPDDGGEDTLLLGGVALADPKNSLVAAARYNKIYVHLK